MKRTLGFLAVTLLMSGIANPALSQKKDVVTSDVIEANSQAYALLAKYKEMVGTVQSASERGVVLRISYNHAVVLPNPTVVVKPPNNDKAENKLGDRLRQLQKELAQVKNDKNDKKDKKGKKDDKDDRNRAARLSGEIQQVQAQIYRLQVQEAQMAQQAAIKTQLSRIKMDKDFIDFDLALSHQLVIRRLVGRTEFDNTGFPIDRPNDGLPGVPAKLSDVTKGDEISVTLSPPLQSPVPPKKDDSGAILAPGIPAGRPYIRMIVIMNDK